MSLKFLSLFLLTMTSFNLHAQISETIQSGRPGQSIGAGVVGYGMFQIQSGVDINKVELSNNENKALIYSNVMRFGLSENFEMSAVLNYQQNEDFANSVKTTDKNGLSDFHLGFRSRIIPAASGLIPALAIQTRFKLTSVDEEFKNKNVAPVVTISAVHGLSQNYTLTTNVGYSNNGNDSTPKYFWTSNVSYSVNQKSSLFIEPYGNFVSNQQNLYLNAGFDYLINNNLKLDFSLGGGTNRSVSEKFASLGFSWRASLIGNSK